MTWRSPLKQFSQLRPAQQTFLLVHPWDCRLLQLPDFADDTRLIARLEQPFSAFLLAQQHGGEYKRVASDNDITAQVKDLSSVWFSLTMLAPELQVSASLEKRKKCKRKRDQDQEGLSHRHSREKTPPVHNQSLADDSGQMDVNDEMDGMTSDIDEVENNVPGPSASASSTVPDAPIAEASATVSAQLWSTNPDASAVLVPHQTAPDAFGLFCVYAQCPTLIPSVNEGLDAIADAPTFDTQGNPHLDRSQLVPGLPSPDIRPEELFSCIQ
ncbi:hypothetical protein F4604DRAFT_1922253 [Suillus subluteus]|nr:hypothetical protein F4604DRAFT_1922253 [Suillus subluteus]